MGENCLIEPDLIVYGVLSYQVTSLVSKTSRWHVQDSLETDLIPCVGSNSKVRKDILDLFTFVESQTTDYPIGCT